MPPTPHKQPHPGNRRSATRNSPCAWCPVESRDLRAEILGQRGWSPAILCCMRRVARVWPAEEESLQHIRGTLPWRHITVLLDRLNAREDRDWYAARPFRQEQRAVRRGPGGQTESTYWRGVQTKGWSVVNARKSLSPVTIKSTAP
ncbi:MAG: DUF1016 N-terminal domain-containing protein [Bifidobacteriaceae bacterium]|nr:DUF1016 N-terminal domain-containing protein [Bifidobacteriaceae bacterium]